ncbi:DUF6879 family protein [Niabella aquatica]
MDIDKIFKEYKSEAFRLETLPQYKVEGEWECFQEFQKRKEVIQYQDLIEYLDETKIKIQEGKRHIRVRAFKSPITGYLQFETLVGYVPQSKIGVELNFIDYNKMETLLKDVNVEKSQIKDFWLFDKTYLFYIIYNSHGEFQDIVEETETSIIQLYVDIRNLLINNSFTLSCFLDNHLL